MILCYPFWSWMGQVISWPNGQQDGFSSCVWVYMSLCRFQCAYFVGGGERASNTCLLWTQKRERQYSTWATKNIRKKVRDSGSKAEQRRELKGCKNYGRILIYSKKFCCCIKWIASGTLILSFSTSDCLSRASLIGLHEWIYMKVWLAETSQLLPPLEPVMRANWCTHTHTQIYGCSHGRNDSPPLTPTSPLSFSLSAALPQRGGWGLGGEWECRDYREADWLLW